MSDKIIANASMLTGVLFSNIGWSAATRRSVAAPPCNRARISPLLFAEMGICGKLDCSFQHKPQLFALGDHSDVSRRAGPLRPISEVLASNWRSRGIKWPIRKRWATQGVQVLPAGIGFDLSLRGIDAVATARPAISTGFPFGRGRIRPADAT